MSKSTLAAGTSPFAHLLAGAAALGSRALGRRAAEEHDDEPQGEEPDDEPKGEEPDDEPKGEEPDDEPKGEEPDDEPKGKRRGRKAERDDDEDAEAKAEDDNDDEEMAQARREGFLAAQARGRRIFSSASAGVRPDMAAHFAFNDSMTSAQAIATLDMAAGAPAPTVPKGSRLGRRMARVVIPNPGTSGGKPEGEKSFGELAKAAAQKAGIL